METSKIPLTTFRASKIAGSVEQVNFDPITILVVIGIIVNLTKIYLECKKPDNVPSIAFILPRKFLAKRNARKTAIKLCANNGIATNLAKPLAFRTVDEVDSMTDEEFQELVNETKSFQLENL